MSKSDDEAAAELYSALRKLIERGFSRKAIDAIVKDFYAQAFPPKPPGRKLLTEDDSHLRRMADILLENRKVRINTAARRVSSEIGFCDNRSTSERLRRKFTTGYQSLFDNTMPAAMNKAVAEWRNAIDNTQRISEIIPLSDVPEGILRGAELEKLSRVLDFIETEIIPKILRRARKCLG